MAWTGKAESVTLTNHVLTEITTVPIRAGAQFLWVSLENSANCEISDFDVAATVVSDQTYHIIANAASDFASDAVMFPIKRGVSNPVGLAESANCAFVMEVKGLDRVRFRGSGTASDAVVDFRWSMR